MKKNFFRNRHLYVITDLKEYDPQIFRKAERSLKGGADILQLRSKTLLDNDYLTIGKRLRGIAKKYRKAFVINDRPHIAALLSADALHLGQDDLPIAFARRIVGKKMIIGKSTHSFSQAKSAVKEGADYIGVGPVFKTPTKPDYGQVGLGLVKKVSDRLSIPFVAIGGIDERNIDLVVGNGARCIAVVRAVLGSREPDRAARKLKAKIIGKG